MGFLDGTVVSVADEDLSAVGKGATCSCKGHKPLTVRDTRTTVSECYARSCTSSRRYGDAGRVQGRGKTVASGTTRRNRRGQADRARETVETRDGYFERTTIHRICAVGTVRVDAEASCRKGGADAS